METRLSREVLDVLGLLHDTKVAVADLYATAQAVADDARSWRMQRYRRYRALARAMWEE